MSLLDTTGGSAVRASGLGRRFHRTWALREADFAVPAGAITAVVGAHGSGKSTLLSLLAGLDLPTTGYAEVLGADPRRRPQPAVSHLGQSRPLYDYLTVAETLRLGRELNRERWDEPYARRLAELGELSPTARVRTLSGGERVHLALALALGPHPDVLLLDEPLAGLDPLARGRVLRAILGEAAESGATVLLASHEIDDLADTCDHLLLLDHGRVRLAGELAPLLDEHLLLTGSAGEIPAWLRAHDVVRSRHTGRQLTALVRRTGELDVPAQWRADAPTLPELVLAYLDPAAESVVPA
ncbi:ATP-binding cassette domain-containing protein [Prauserella cavernicola]|uniref:ABC transporter ATP-binding protein n=1 Tax=Prauserella cavernicola TaxID=2800127 RepID=A0A934QQD9_9PSEU|nr:ABC transporter ATP-binding protein [Prauserella cavernicola]MBK1783799.1 ABC transporter ATP-binding protein [Prauserella cavernicola]